MPRAKSVSPKRSRSPCSPGKVRDRVTKRCRSPKRAASPKRSRSPCKKGMVRSPNNKCMRRPCSPGKVRDRVTKRCRSPIKRGRKVSPGRKMGYESVKSPELNTSPKVLSPSYDPIFDKF